MMIGVQIYECLIESESMGMGQEVVGVRPSVSRSIDLKRRRRAASIFLFSNSPSEQGRLVPRNPGVVAPGIRLGIWVGFLAGLGAAANQRARISESESGVDTILIGGSFSAYLLLWAGHLPWLVLKMCWAGRMEFFLFGWAPDWVSVSMYMDLGIRSGKSGHLGPVVVRRSQGIWVEEKFISASMVRIVGKGHRKICCWYLELAGTIG